MVKRRNSESDRTGGQHKLDSPQSAGTNVGCPGQCLTCFGDVERQPEQEGVADQLSEEQTEGKLHHALQTHARCHSRNLLKGSGPTRVLFSPGYVELP